MGDWVERIRGYHADGQSCSTEGFHELMGIALVRKKDGSENKPLP